MERAPYICTQGKIFFGGNYYFYYHVIIIYKMSSRAEEAIRNARRIDSERTLIESEINSLLPNLGAAGMKGSLVDGP